MTILPLIFVLCFLFNYFCCFYLFLLFHHIFLFIFIHFINISFPYLSHFISTINIFCFITSFIFCFIISSPRRLLTTPFSTITGPGDGVIEGGQFRDDKGSHFFAYFLTVMVTAIIFYLVFHNKQRVSDDEGEEDGIETGKMIGGQRDTAHRG